MTIKVVRKGFEKKSLKHWKLSEERHCLNIFGIAVFINK